MMMAISLRKAALATAAALALFALSSTEVSGQSTALPPTFKDAAAENEYKAKMRRVVAQVRNVPAQQLPEVCNIRMIAFSDAIIKYNRDPVLQRLLVNISESTLINYANFVNCRDPNDAKIRVVNSTYEDNFRTLMVANGVIPNTETAYGPAYQPTAPDGKRQLINPALKDAPKN
ncbi:MAG: hypothetical protein SFW65_04600 [Alphaproteobacteria bacterium]|nr:hypothetical protein [Alphaproteobacteria bacterium]